MSSKAIQFHPNNYKYQSNNNKQKQKFETFRLDFDLVFLIFLYATAFEKLDILKELERNFIHKLSFFKNYENWVHVMTPTDLNRFKSVLLKSINDYRYEGGFSILHYLATSKLEDSLEIIVKDNIFEDLNVKCNQGATPLDWSKYCGKTKAISILTEALKEQCNNYNE